MAKKIQELTPEEIDRQIQIDHVINATNQNEIEAQRVINEEDQTLTEKINCLGHLCTILQVDEDNVIPGNETKYKALFSSDELHKIKIKLFELINKL